MNRLDITKKKFIIFLVVTFSLAWIIQITASVFANNGNQGVLIAGISLKGMGWVPHLKGKLRYLFFALWAPALLSIIGGALFFAIFPNAFDSELLALSGYLQDAGMLEQLKSQGLTARMRLSQMKIITKKSICFIKRKKT